MEDGTGILPGGSDDHHDPARIQSEGVRSTLDHDGLDIRSPAEDMKFPWSSQTSHETPSSPARSPSHRRTLSGSILARLNFLRAVGEDGEAPTRNREFTSPKGLRNGGTLDEEALESSSMKLDEAAAGSLKQSKTRKRKGSLRKTALLGGKRLITSEGRERSKSLLQRSPSTKHSLQPVYPQIPAGISETATTISGGLYPPPLADDRAQALPLRQPSYQFPSAASSSDSGWSESAAVTAARLSLVTDHQVSQVAGLASSNHYPDSQTGGTTLRSPLDLKSPVSQASYASTTDDEEALTFHRPSVIPKPIDSSVSLLPDPASETSSYFPPQSSLSRTRSSHSSRAGKPRPSPLHAHPLTPVSSPPPTYDYTETEYWGWVILFTTWLIFAVGMGSCLEVWSWAWDVGETPYAPPELEDDPTLPIVGYYPALIVLTGVVAWVWIFIAWVGMKYFRHAKIEV